jgi:aminoglycoside 6'-N-acetyltransferase
METISFRPLVRADFPEVSRWLAAPHVARWWQRPADLASIETAYGPCIDGTDPTKMFAIEVDGTPVGLIKCYRLADYPDWERAVDVTGAAGIDYLVGEVSQTGKGVASQAIREFTVSVFERYPEVGAVVAAPQQENVASWRALENAGYERHWEGKLDSDDPSDAAASFVYVRRRQPA